MEIEVKPQPSNDEREAILAALAAADEPGEPGASAWRRAALEEAIEGLP